VISVREPRRSGRRGSAIWLTQQDNREVEDHIVLEALGRRRIAPIIDDNHFKRLPGVRLGGKRRYTPPQRTWTRIRRNDD